jgi:diguanylate cyclase
LETFAPGRVGLNVSVGLADTEGVERFVLSEAVVGRHRWLLWLTLASLALYVATVPLRPPEGAVSFRDAGLFNIPFVCAALICFRHARAEPRDRLAWGLFGTSMAIYAVANLLGTLVVGTGPDAPFPSIADAGWLTCYPLYYAGLVLLARSRAARSHLSVWFDGAVAGFGAAAIVVWVLLGPALADIGGRFSTVATNTAYPVADVLLIMVIVIAVGLLGWRPTMMWSLLAAAFAMFALSDGVFLHQEVLGTYHEGGFVDAGWLVGAVLLALACLARESRYEAPRQTGLLIIAVPAVFVVSSLALLTYGQGRSLPTIAVVCAIASIVLALVRLGLTFREVQGLAETRRLARTDDLTGLANRRHFYEQLNDRLRSRPPAEPLAVVILDLDRFKEINDSLGHAAGDALLVGIGPRVIDVLRPGDLLARLGGDEFALFLEGAGQDEAYVIASRIVREIALPFVVGDMTLHVEASVGVAIWPDDGDEVDELVARADVAMFVAKSMRTSVELYEPERDRAYLDRFGVIEALRAAIGSDQLVLHYQPKLHLPTGCVVGAEALVRWEDPARGLVPPDRFIPLAEQAGLMGALTAWVLRQALVQTVAWRDQGLAMGIAVNVSASSLRESGFPDLVADLLRETGVPPDVLTLEITEDTVMSDRERCLDVLHRLRSFGIRISVDDYGTGHSSLAYLKELPVDELKLDRSFISTMNDDQRLAAIVESTIGLAHSLGLPIVAEGVETLDVRDRLTTAGCDLIQGYLLTRPLPGADLTTWLAENSSPIAEENATGAHPRL